MKRRASGESTEEGEDSGNRKRSPRQEDSKGEGRRDHHGMNGKEHFSLKDCKSSSESSSDLAVPDSSFSAGNPHGRVC